MYSNVLERERLHIDAVLQLSEGNLTKACQVWNSITVQYPLGKLGASNYVIVTNSNAGS